MADVDLAPIRAMTSEQRLHYFAGLTQRERKLYAEALYPHVTGLDPLAHLTWRQWNATVAPHLIQTDYAPEHQRFWEWVDTISDSRPDPFLAIWPRGYAKSSTAELAVVRLFARGLRTYCLYVCHTQDQADDHVQNIAAILERSAFARHYPALGAVKVNKWGKSTGWRRNRLRTAAGCTIDALGLDVSRRGAKLEEERPDLMVLDDIDSQHASMRVVQKNLTTITNALIPALQPNKVIVMAQNIVAPNSIAAQIADGRAEILGGAIRSGPFPLIENAVMERQTFRDVDTGDTRAKWVLTGGTPRWPQGMGLARSSDQLTDIGPEAFRIECQQDVTQRPGAIWRRNEIRYWPHDTLPEFDKIIVSVDPNRTGRSDDTGMLVLARATLNGDRYAFVLEDHSQLTEPSQWREDLGRLMIEWEAGYALVELAGLGEHGELSVKGAKSLGGRLITVKDAETRGVPKPDRARAIHPYYTTGRVFHAKPLPYLERQMTSWVPDEDPISPGAIDALAHGIRDLLITSGAPNIAVADDPFERTPSDPVVDADPAPRREPNLAVAGR